MNVTFYDQGHSVGELEIAVEDYTADQAPEGAMAWIDIEAPSMEQMEHLAEAFNLHELVIEDAVQGHQRPKLERYGQSLFAVVHSARYREAAEEVEFGELQLILGDEYVTTISHKNAPDLKWVRARLERNADLLALGPEAVLYGVIDAVVDDYIPVVRGLEQDIDEIEVAVFSRVGEVSRRIYELSREVADFQRAARALYAMLGDLTAGFAKYGVTTELQEYLRDVTDHLTEVRNRLDDIHASLRDILTVNATLVAQEQNEEMRAMTEATNAENIQTKKITGWAAIIFAPTVIAGMYGMNFDYMPETHWYFGYPMAVGMMIGSAAVLYAWFKRSNWL